MGSLKPGKSIIYERDDKGTIWARYHGEKERWLVGGPSNEKIFCDYVEWRDILEAARENPTLGALLEKTINTYRLIK